MLKDAQVRGLEGQLPALGGSGSFTHLVEVLEQLDDHAGVTAAEQRVAWARGFVGSSSHGQGRRRGWS